jgi:hypothetical protein
MLHPALMVVRFLTLTLPAAAGEPCREGEPAAVHGTVFDETTRVPLVGASVTMTHRPEGERRDRTETTQTEGGGVFRFCGVASGQQVQLAASYGYGNATPRTVTVGAAPAIRLGLRAPLSVLTGRVHAGEGVLEAAAVRLTGTPLEVLSTTDGRFRFQQVPAGRYELTVTLLGYQTVMDSVSVELSSTVDVAVRMTAGAVPLEPITVSTRSFHLERVGFYQRQERLSGAFITRDVINRSQPRYASDLLRAVPGIRMDARRGYGSMPVGRGNCGFRYVVDGARIGPGFEIDDLLADWIEAIEIYRGPAEVPGEFTSGPGNPRANCGVIVVWTRVR